ncbi:MAG: LysR family transcriptional regulator [Pseudomonadota bacterium]
MKRLEDLDLNLLILLHWLLEEKSVSRAAGRIGISQPAASRGLQRLRDAYADELLVRSGRGYVLSRLATSIASDLAASVGLLRRVANAKAEFRPAHSQDTVVIAANDYLARICSQAWIESIAPHAPSMASTWRPLEPAVLGELAAGTVDFVAIPDAARANIPEAALLQDLVSKPLIKDRFVVFGRSSHVIFKKRPLTAEALADHNSVLVSPSGSGPAILDKALQSQGLTRRVVHRTSGFTHAADLALAANMIAVLPERLAQEQSKGRYAPLPLDEEQLNSSLVWHASRTSDESHRWIRQQLFNHFA